jgi:PPOX class probable F420-dependent enzyme
MGTSSSVAELPGWARSLLQHERIAHLGLIDDAGLPRVLPVVYAACGEVLVTAVDHKPKSVPPDRLARVRWLHARPQATITVDHYDEDWSQLAWVQASGTVRIVEEAGFGELVSALVERYPQYRERPPGGPLLVLAPERLVWWKA